MQLGRFREALALADNAERWLREKCAGVPWGDDKACFPVDHHVRDRPDRRRDDRNADRQRLHQHLRNGVSLHRRNGKHVA